MSETMYTLMNKNRPVLDFLYDLETHRIVKILETRDLAYAPLGILDKKGNPTRIGLDSWWRQRSIPASGATSKS